MGNLFNCLKEIRKKKKAQLSWHIQSSWKLESSKCRTARNAHRTVITHALLHLQCTYHRVAPFQYDSISQQLISRLSVLTRTFLGHVEVPAESSRVMSHPTSIPHLSGVRLPELQSQPWPRHRRVPFHQFSERAGSVSSASPSPGLAYCVTC